MTYRLKASVDATRQVPGGEYTVRTPLVGTGPGNALSSGVVGIPAGSLSGASFGVPLGDVVSPGAVLLQNGQQDLNVRLNGATSPLRLGSGAVLLIEQTAGSESDQLSSISVSTVTAQTQSGSLTFVISGQARAISPIGAWVMDNSPFPSSPTNLNSAELWGWREATLAVSGYSGPPDVIIRLPSEAGRGHAFCILPDGYMVVATSEDNAHGGDNGYESWFLVPPGVSGDLTLEQCPRIKCRDLFAGTVFESYGARHAILLGDGTILLGSNAMWRQVPVEAFTWPAGELTSLPMWTISGSLDVGEYVGSYDYAVVPGTRRVEINGDDKVYQLDFSVAPGTNLSTTAKIMVGSNIGGPFNQNWVGDLALDASGGLWKLVGRLARLHWWSADTLALRPNSGAFNPAPDRVLRVPLIEALNINTSGLYEGLDIDRDGNLWLHTNRWDPVNDPTQALMMRIPASAVATGGLQVQDRLLLLPAHEQATQMRLPPNVRLFPR